MAPIADDAGAATSIDVPEDMGDAPINTSTPYAVTIGDTFFGELTPDGERDWIRLDLDASETAVINMNGLSLSDPYLRLYNGSGTLIAENDDFTGLDSQITITNGYTPGTYFIEAGEFDDDDSGTYEVVVTEGTASITAYDPLDALDWGPNATVPGTGPGGGTIDVYFAGAGETFGGVTSEGWLAYEIQQFEVAFAQIEALTNIDFNIVGSSVGADFNLVLDTNEVGYLGAFFPPGTGPDSGTGIFNANGTGWDVSAGGGLEVGGYGYITIIHELGHGLGLSHPHDTGGGSTILPGVSDIFNDTGTHQLNQGVFTTMSYVDGWVAGPVGTAAPVFGGNYGYQGTMMALDIAALQDRYGANMSTSTGNDTYTLPTTNALGTYWESLWDAGGTDAIFNPSANNSTIDLRSATLLDDFNGGGYISAVDGIAGGFTIPNGVVIENAFGGSGADNIIGNPGANLLSGLLGTDTLMGLNGDDTLDGGEGNDLLFGGRGNDVIFDGIIGDSQGVDTISAGAGDDFVIANYFTNAEIYSGGTGDDTLDTRPDNVGGITVDLVGGTMSGGGATAVISGFEAVFTDIGANLVTGNDNDNRFETGEGNDTILGGLGRDTILGMDGDDSIDGGKSSDLLVGGIGSDTIIAGGGNDEAQGGAQGDLIQTGSGSDTIFGEGGNDTLNGGPNGDQIIGGSGNDSIAGSGGQDTIWGGIGDDTLRGVNGNDTLYGEDGDDLIFGDVRPDMLFGGADNDTLRGGDAGDTLNGGTGNDDLRGEANADVFVFEDGFGVDRIRDFDEFNNNEDIDLSAVTAITDYADLVANHMTQSGSNVIIDDLAGNTIRIDNALVGDMNSADFLFTV